MVRIVFLLLFGWMSLQMSGDVRADTPATGAAEWNVLDGSWNVKAGTITAEGKYSILLKPDQQPQDFQLLTNMRYGGSEPQVAAGVVFRFSTEDRTGYIACVRDIEKGNDPKWGPWERPVLQLIRLDPDGWKTLQESKVPQCWGERSHALKVVAAGADLSVFFDDDQTPVIRQYDPTYLRLGQAGLWKDQLGTATFDGLQTGAVRQTPVAASRTDWSWVRGAVYIRSDAVNAVQMWEDYWDHTDVLDRELSYAHLYGFNMIQVYLHWIVWDKHQGEYVKRIDDLLARADRYHLKVNFVLWDDCGNVEPSLSFSPPIPGRHNSQMMPNPSHAIRDDAESLHAHRSRFEQYIKGVVSPFKDDPRISFWQIYNECMGPREQYRDGVADANLNLLLQWTRQWIKSVGCTAPLTATGGGFYGPKYADFYTYHSYRLGPGSLPNADGGSAHLCTETLDRPYANVLDCLEELGGKQNGFVVWDLMIGRDNCRFPWGHPDGAAEPPVPFHGVVLPDGHPWDVREVRALLGDQRYSELCDRSFKVEYFDDTQWKTLRKTSIAPCIDFTLPDERCSASPDPCAGISPDHYSIRWIGRRVAADSGDFTLSAKAEGSMRVRIDGIPVLETNAMSPAAKTTIPLKQGQSFTVEVTYAHDHLSGAGVHLTWSGPHLRQRVFTLSDN
jgi:hypothetical protein